MSVLFGEIVRSSRGKGVPLWFGLNIGVILPQRDVCCLAVEAQVADAVMNKQLLAKLLLIRPSLNGACGLENS